MAREVESHSDEQVTVVVDLGRETTPAVVLEALREQDAIDRSATPIEAKIEHLFSRIEAELAAHPLEDGYTHPAEALLRFSKGEVLKFIAQAVEDGRVSLATLPDKVRTEVEKKLG